MLTPSPRKSLAVHASYQSMLISVISCSLGSIYFTSRELEFTLLSAFTSQDSSLRIISSSRFPPFPSCISTSLPYLPGANYIYTFRGRYDLWSVHTTLRVASLFALINPLSSPESSFFHVNHEWTANDRELLLLHLVQEHAQRLNLDGYSKRSLIVA